MRLPWTPRLSKHCSRLACALQTLKPWQSLSDPASPSASRYPALLLIRPMLFQLDNSNSNSPHISDAVALCHDADIGEQHKTVGD